MHVNRALKYLSQYRGIAIGALLSLLLVNGANLITPIILQSLIDDGILLGDINAVWFATGSLIAVAAIRGLFNFLQGYWSEVASQGVAFDLRNQIFENLQNLSFSYHDRAQTGKLMTRMTSDVDIVRMYVGRGFLQLLSAAVMLLGTALAMFMINWQLALIVIAVIPLILAIFMVMMRSVFPISRTIQMKLGALNSILQENLAGMRVVKAFARQEYEINRYTSQNQALLDENLKFVRLFTTYFPFVFFISNLGILGVVWFGGNQVILGQLSLGTLVAFISYLGLLLMPVFLIGMITAMLSRAEASAQRIFEVLDAQSEVQEIEDAVLLQDVSGEVEFKDVSFRYVGGEQDVLSGLSFKVKPGQTVAILGQTGSGKSTIINMIPRFYDVTSGSVTIDGLDVRNVQLESLRTQVGIVLQENTLFSGTLRDNISYGRPEADIAEVLKAAKAAQIHEFIDELPQKYDTVVGERGIGLSGGQKQRVAIARALLVQPKILILDDSTSSVDAETEYKIQQALQDLMQARTSFVIAQRISTVRDADLILLLDKGKLVSQGTHEKLLETSELYYEILDSQFGDWSHSSDDAKEVPA
ncbi:MAG: ABC transporter ATP-binding protein/permease [Chloroflexota bacterium]